jgi:DDE superfamily endonuclease
MLEVTNTTSIPRRRPVVEQLIPSLAELLAPFRPCFRQEVFLNFQHVFVAWILCLGPRTLSEVWQVCSLRGIRHFTAIYHLFHSAQWDWDELGTLLVLLVLVHLIPSGYVWIVVDDTLCHKRGAKVAFGGFFLDAVRSSKRRKVFSFGVNHVVLGLVVCLPFRPDRYHCLPVLWRVFRKKGLAGHQKRTTLAADMARLAADLMPSRDVVLVADSAYVNAAVLRNRPANLQMIGPLPLKAALYELPGEPWPGQRGRRRKKGNRLLTPRQLFEDTTACPAVEQLVTFPGKSKRLRVQVLPQVLWYTGCKTDPVQVVLVRDPSGSWPDTALLCTQVGLNVTEVIQGYSRRWSVEVMFHDSKQYLGFQDPQVWSQRSVERAHTLAWFCYSVTLLWYALHGSAHESVPRDRPWYTGAIRPAFAEILGTLRLALWRGRYFGEAKDPSEQLQTVEIVQALLHGLAAVR